LFTYIAGHPFNQEAITHHDTFSIIIVLLNSCEAQAPDDPFGGPWPVNMHVLRPAEEFVSYNMEMSPLPVKGCKIYIYARRSGPWSREESLSCHICCDMGPRFFWFHPKDRPIQSLLKTRKEMPRTHRNH
jgi:hypothetical protein